MAQVTTRNASQTKGDSDPDALGFATFTELSPRRRLITMTSGHTGSGKTDWALRTGPEPVFHVITDPNAEEVHKAVMRETGRDLRHIRIDYDRANIPGLRDKTDAEAKAAWAKQWENFSRAYRGALKLGQGTLVVDTATEVYELQRLAEFGRLSQRGQNYGPINREQKDLIAAAYDSNLNVIFIHKLRKIYTGSGDNASWDGKSWEPACWSDMPYEVECRIDHSFQDGQFRVTIRKNTRSYELVGLEAGVIEEPMGFSDVLSLTFA